MATSRIHPERYKRIFFTLMEDALHSRVAILFQTKAAARAYRLRLYGAREALSKYPEFNSSLSKHAHKLTFRIQPSSINPEKYYLYLQLKAQYL